MVHRIRCLQHAVACSCCNTATEILRSWVCGPLQCSAGCLWCGVKQLRPVATVRCSLWDCSAAQWNKFVNYSVLSCLAATVMHCAHQQRRPQQCKLCLTAQLTEFKHAVVLVLSAITQGHACSGAGPAHRYAAVASQPALRGRAEIWDVRISRQTLGHDSWMCQPVPCIFVVVVCVVYVVLKY
jgi:hypothetical protein